MTPEVFAACREFHLSHGEAAYSRLLKLAPPDVSATLWSNYQYGLYLDAVNAGACRHGCQMTGCDVCAAEAGRPPRERSETEAREAAEEAAADRGLDPCQRCGKRDLLTRLLVLVSPQTHGSPAEYEELSLCMDCTPDDSHPRERGDDDGPPDADHELGNTARERDERAWDEKEMLRHGSR